MSFEVNFLKIVGRNSKKKFTRTSMRSYMKLSRSLEFISASLRVQQMIITRACPDRVKKEVRVPRS